MLIWTQLDTSRTINRRCYIMAAGEIVFFCSFHSSNHLIIEQNSVHTSVCLRFVFVNATRNSVSNSRRGVNTALNTQGGEG